MAIRTKDHSLQELLQAMNPQEIDILRHYLTAFGSRKEAEPLSLRLMDMLLKSKDPLSDAICSKKLYGKAKDNRYEKLKSRLKQKVLDSLINDINIERNKDWDDIELVTIKLRKKLAQYYFLSLSKPNQAMIQHLLDEIIQVAKKYESYQVLSEALKFKKYHIGFKKGEKSFEDLSNEIKIYEQCQLASNNANDLFFRMLLIQNFNSNIEKVKYRRYLNRSIDKLNTSYNKTNSSAIGYYLYLLKRNLDVLDEDYDSAAKTSKKILDLLENNPAIYRKQRIGSTYLFLSQCEIENHKNNDAIKFARNAKAFFSENSNNYFAALDVEFHAFMLNGQYNDAFLLAQELTGIANSQESSLRKGKYLLYRACSNFELLKYRECLQHQDQPIASL